MITINTNTDIICIGSKMILSASGGVAPYVFTLISGGDGGEIVDSNFYVAPSTKDKGFQKIKVVDSLGASTSKEVTILNHLEIICNIIKAQMSLAADQVVIYNEKFIIPNDSRLYVMVGVLNEKMFSNNSSGDEVSMNVLQTLTLDVFSRGNSAFSRKEEVVMALHSQYSKNKQTESSFYIGRIPSGFSNVSYEEGISILNRFNISINIGYHVKKKFNFNYYDQIQEAGVNHEQ